MRAENAAYGEVISVRLPDDILQRIAVDYPDAAAEFVQDALEGLAVPERDRVVRCVLFSAAGDLTSFSRMLALARLDYRDAILCGEYDPDTRRRVRNMAAPFIA